MLLRILLCVSLVASSSIKDADNEETDGQSSRKILGSSVVTSVSVVMETGNGKHTYYADAVGHPISKPNIASQVASPINLLNPDRYEFYTFNDDGELVKRLMTLQEIQGIIAGGDSDGLSDYNSQILNPNNDVSGVVENVQNVLKEEMEAHQNPSNPILDTPDVSANWNLILPAIFGDSMMSDMVFDESTTDRVKLSSRTPSTTVIEADEPIIINKSTTHKTHYITSNLPETTTKKTEFSSTTARNSEDIIIEQVDKITNNNLNDELTLNMGQLNEQNATSTAAVITENTNLIDALYNAAISMTTARSTSSSSSTTIDYPKITELVSIITRPPQQTIKMSENNTEAAPSVTFPPFTNTYVQFTQSSTPKVNTNEMNPLQTTTTNSIAAEINSIIANRTDDDLTDISTDNENVANIIGQILNNPMNQTYSFASAIFDSNFAEGSTLKSTSLNALSKESPDILSADTTTRSVTNPLILTTLKYINSVMTEQPSVNEAEVTTEIYDNTTPLFEITNLSSTTTENNIVRTTTSLPIVESTVLLTTETDKELINPSSKSSDTTILNVTNTSELTKTTPIVELRNDFSTPESTSIKITNTIPIEITSEANTIPINITPGTSTVLDENTSVITTEANVLPETTPGADIPVETSSGANIPVEITSGNYIPTEINSRTNAPETTSDESVLLNEFTSEASVSARITTDFSTPLDSTSGSSVLIENTSDPSSLISETNSIQFTSEPTVNEITSDVNQTVEITSETNKGVEITSELNKGVEITSETNKEVEITSEPNKGIEIKTEPNEVVEITSGVNTVPIQITSEANTVPISFEENTIFTENTSELTSTIPVQFDSETSQFISGINLNEITSEASTISETTIGITTPIKSSVPVEVTVPLEITSEPSTVPVKITSAASKLPIEISSGTSTIPIAVTLESATISSIPIKNSDKIITSTALPSTEFNRRNTSITTKPITTSSVKLTSSSILNISEPYRKTEDASQTNKIDTWKLVETVKKPSDKTTTPKPNFNSYPPIKVDLTSHGTFGGTPTLNDDMSVFSRLYNELALKFWTALSLKDINSDRSTIVSPFGTISMLAMIFLGARGGTSGEMNDVLKLDDFVTFNTHLVFKEVTESVLARKTATAVVRELYSDLFKGKVLGFYKERVRQFYDGHVEEVEFKRINNVIRRRTNALINKQTRGQLPQFLEETTLSLRPPLSALSTNIFQADCSDASTEGRDGELYFIVIPSMRQRRLVPIPAAVWRSGFIAGYDPELDATAVSLGAMDQAISTIFVIPGQQGHSAPGDVLLRLESRLLNTTYIPAAWTQLLKSMLPRPGLEIQLPRFLHKSVINTTDALKRMGLREMFNQNKADLRGLNGNAHGLYLADMMQVNEFSICAETQQVHAEVYPSIIENLENHNEHMRNFKYEDYIEVSEYDKYASIPLPLRPRQARLPDIPRLRFDRPFLYFVRHNPTGLILHMGRFNPRLAT